MEGVLGRSRHRHCCCHICNDADVVKTIKAGYIYIDYYHSNDVLLFDVERGDICLKLVFPPTCLYTKESLMACIQQPIYYETETKTGTLGKIKRVDIADSLTSVTAPTPLHQPPGQQKKRPSGVYRSAAAGRKRRAA